MLVLLHVCSSVCEWVDVLFQRGESRGLAKGQPGRGDPGDGGEGTRINCNAAWLLQDSLYLVGVTMHLLCPVVHS